MHFASDDLLSLHGFLRPSTVSVSGTPHSLGLNQVLNIAILGWSSMNARTDNSYRAAGPPLDELQRPCRDSSINTLRHPTVLLVSHLCGPATTGPHHS